ncbi:MAG: DUF4830 domain-containing protein [Firmicutes bacterium]|nr:DUF4830 domain-containing protein [Bacillota bacterium]
MAKGRRISLKQIVFLVLVITCSVFFVKHLVGFIEENTGSFSAQKAADYLAGYGWSVKEDKVNIEEIIIPSDFSEVYERYNAIQLKQGFDLTKYKGEGVVKYTFVVTNYKGFDNVEAHVLVKGGRVIGGDICSTELNGFMAGFDGKTQ